MRIAHLSDPHLLSLEGARVRDFLSKRWIGGLNLLANRARAHRPEVFDAMVDDINAAGVDHVVCTGDLTNVALPGELARARAHLDRLALGPARVTVVPGNHDAYVQAGVRLFAEQLGDYCAPDEGWAWPDGARWPVVRVRGPVAIVGVSTSRQTPWFTAWGELGAAQLERLERALGDARLAGRFRLLAIHHPPAGAAAAHWRHGLRDRAALAEVLGRVGAELVLHGHEHLDLRAELAGPGGRAIPVRGIPSATYAGHRAAERAAYRIYTVGDEASGAGEELRVWRRDGGGFSPASS